MKKNMMHGLIGLLLFAQSSFGFGDEPCYPGDPDRSGQEFVQLLKELYKKSLGSLFNKDDKNALNKEDTNLFDQLIKKRNAVGDSLIRLNRDEEQAIVAALHVVLLSVCKEHKKNHLQGHLLKNRRYTESHSVQESLNQEYKKELSLLGFSRIVQFCQKYNR